MDWYNYYFLHLERGAQVEERLKRRLVGAAVLVALAVIFLPMLVEEREPSDRRLREPLPPVPETPAFQSRILPVPPESDASPEPGIQPRPIPDPSPVPDPGGAGGSAHDMAETMPPGGRPPLPRESPPPAIPPPTQIPAQDPPRPTLAPPAPVATPPKTRTGVSSWVVQVSALESQTRAEQLVAQLRNKGQSAFIEPIGVNGKTLHRVRVGPELDRKRAEAMLDEIYRILKIKGQVVAYP